MKIVNVVCETNLFTYFTNLSINIYLLPSVKLDVET